jgi:TolA-binding protein
MGQHDAALKRLGRAVGDAQDEALQGASFGSGGVSFEQGRERLLVSMARARQSGSASATTRARRGTWVGGGVAFAAALAAAVAFLLLRPASMTFRADNERGTVGGWLAAPPGGELPLSFSDGTSVRLDREARARVARIDEKGAQLVLESGRARASVIHREDTRWDVDVGPYQVRVTGTRFDVSWDPTVEVFLLVLEEGSVRVTGPLLGDGLAVVAGQTVRAAVKEQRLEISAGGKPIAAAPAADPSQPAQALDPAPAIAPPPAPAGDTPPAAAEPEPIDLDDPAALLPSGAAANPPPASGPRVPVWRQLAAAGKYKEALAAVEKLGFDEVCATGSPGDLMTLSDAARLAGSGARATQALAALRERFPGDKRASMAAFVQGKIAFDQRGAYADAARWFETYLREQPAGPVAREAAGRLMEARQRSGDLQGARSAAESYLKAYPMGPHAEMARKLLGD